MAHLNNRTATCSDVNIDGTTKLTVETGNPEELQETLQHPSFLALVDTLTDADYAEDITHVHIQQTGQHFKAHIHMDGHDEPIHAQWAGHRFEEVPYAMYSAMIPKY